MNASIDWKGHIVRFFFVTLGVFIAFGLNTCNENRKERKRVQLYLDGLSEELRDNQQHLEVSLPYHQTLLQSLRESPEEANLIMNPAPVSNAAWELADNEIFKKYVDHEVYKKLARLYQTHGSLIFQHQEASRLMSESNVFVPLYGLSLIDKDLTPEDEIQLAAHLQQGWIPIFESWTAEEESYLRQIEELLALLKKR